MGYKMKGSPAKLGTIQGTSGHASALKAAEEVSVSSPNKGLFDIFSKEGRKQMKEKAKIRKAEKTKRKAQEKKLKALRKKTKKAVKKEDRAKELEAYKKKQQQKSITQSEKHLSKMSGITGADESQKKEKKIDKPGTVVSRGAKKFGKWIGRQAKSITDPTDEQRERRKSIGESIEYLFDLEPSYRAKADIRAEARRKAQLKYPEGSFQDILGDDTSENENENEDK